MEFLVLGAFCAALLACLWLRLSILYAIAAGLLLFGGYAVGKGVGPKELLRLCLSGLLSVKKILLAFLLIGMLTALWRQAGTVSFLVSCAARLMTPSLFLLSCFLFNALISVLTGTAFGTAATMGVICATVGAGLGISPVLIGGAVLSGAYFGDRCSPVSTSALLVATLTKTDLYRNGKAMWRSAAVPLLLSCGLYALVGCWVNRGGTVPDLGAIFAREFSLSPVVAVPALILLVLALCRVNVLICMLASILSAIPLVLWVQRIPLGRLPLLLIFGFEAQDAQVARMLSGGGIASMLTVGAIVLLSSAYAGIFEATGLLDRLKRAAQALMRKTSSFVAVAVCSLITGVIACNQTLTVILTHQLTKEELSDQSRLALELENSAVVIAPLVPWSIACAVPLTSVGAPLSSVAFAFFLYLLPLWEAIRSLWKKAREKKKG